MRARVPASRLADAVVIGAGLHGCSVALQLARAGLRCAVIEKDHAGRHASGVNAGGVRRLGRAFEELPLAEAAIALWRDIEALVGDRCGFVASGQVKVAVTEADLAVLVERAARLRTLGYAHEEIVDRDRLRELLPAVAPACVGGTWVRGDGYADPFRTVLAFRRAAAAAGATFHEGIAVTAIERRGETWRIATPRGGFESRVLVNCAGAWGGEVARMLGEPVPIAARAPMLMITARMPRFVEPVVGAQGRTLSFKQLGNGTVLIGGGHLGEAFPATNETRVDFAGLAVSARTAAEIFPVMRRASVVRAWAGIEGYLPDGLPVIGPSAREGAFHAFGFSAHGFQLGPAVGRVLAELVTGGQSRIPVAAFRISRFDA